MESTLKIYQRGLLSFVSSDLHDLRKQIKAKGTEEMCNQLSSTFKKLVWWEKIGLGWINVMVP